MSTEIIPTEPNNEKVNVRVQGGSADAVYGIGLFGAWVYFIGRATTNQERIVGFFKGFIWPAILVYKLLEFFDKEG